MPFSAAAQEIITALHLCGSELVFGDPLGLCRGVTTDSRQISAEALFVARIGAALDGHVYLHSAYDSGAGGCLVERSWAESAGPELWAKLSAQQSQEQHKSTFFVIACDDTTRALGLLAGFWRSKLALPTIAITGSNGKTSTREITKTLLTTLVGPGTGSIKSFNNHVGLPETVLNSSPEDRWLVLEAGMNHSGELDYLGRIAQPDTVVVLNIGPAHFENFGSLAGIADAKCELLAHAARFWVTNLDDAELQQGLARLMLKLGTRCTSLDFGVSKNAAVRASDITAHGSAGLQFRLHLNGQSAPVKLPHLGQHNVLNATAAVAAVATLFPDFQAAEYAEALSVANRVELRLELIPLGSLTIINDAYNANPASMQAAIETTRVLAAGKPFGCVLGDMFELGSESAHFHRQLGERVGRAAPNFLVALGNYAPQVIEGAQSVGCTVGAVVDSPSAAVLAVREQPELAYLLVKGSRGMKLERVVAELLAG